MSWQCRYGTTHVGQEACECSDQQQPDMKSMLVAVFGHYDSRGGTTAIPLKDQSAEALDEARREYAKAFGWEEMLAEYRKDLERPEGERKWQWDPTKPGSGPHYDDFLYIAKLWYPEGATMKTESGSTDLEEMGVVIIEAGIDEPRTMEFIPLGMSRYQHEELYNKEREEEGRAASWEEFIQSIARVVKTLEDGEVPNWNDDAFGFIIGTGLKGE